MCMMGGLRHDAGRVSVCLGLEGTDLMKEEYMHV